MAKSNLPEILNFEATLLLRLRWPFNLNECNNGCQYETEPPRAVSLCTVLYFPLAAPLLTTFPSSTQVPVSLECSMIIILTIPNLHSQDIHIYPNCLVLPLIPPHQHDNSSLPSYLCRRPRDTAVWHWGVCRAREQHENEMEQKPLQIKMVYQNNFFVLNQHLLLWNCSRSQYFFSSGIHSKAKSLFIHEWHLKSR